MAAKFKFETLDTPIEADWPVRVNVPQDGGTTELQEFTARFRLLTQEDDTEISKSAVPAIEGMRRALVGIDGEKADPALVEKLLATPYVRIAINNAYGGFCAGIAVKN